MSKMGSKALSRELAKLAAQVHDVLPDGTPITKEEVLADLVWKFALGYTETTTDDNGNKKVTKHPPVAWAMQYLYERLEGRVPVAMPDQVSGMKAADKVRDLAKQRLNKAAATQAGPPTPKAK